MGTTHNCLSVLKEIQKDKDAKRREGLSLWGLRGLWGDFNFHHDNGVNFGDPTLRDCQLDLGFGGLFGGKLGFKTSQYAKIFRNERSMDLLWL